MRRVSMHLLVLSAFRLINDMLDYMGYFSSQCTFWCSVLSDSESSSRRGVPGGSQCTFWCSVLSDVVPFVGEDCFVSVVSMHLLVLSAFRPPINGALLAAAVVSMHLLVLSAFRQPEGVCDDTRQRVSMHLLVLSAFRPSAPAVPLCSAGLNAPFGAQCFPTGYRVCRGLCARTVSMHLLVLSAFRLDAGTDPDGRLDWSQCTFWCSVLSDVVQRVPYGLPLVVSQCTFWCSVLSDVEREELVQFCRRVSMHLLVLSAFRRS